MFTAIVCWCISYCVLMHVLLSLSLLVQWTQSIAWSNNVISPVLYLNVSCKECELSVSCPHFSTASRGCYRVSRDLSSLWVPWTRTTKTWWLTFYEWQLLSVWWLTGTHHWAYTVTAFNYCTQVLCTRYIQGKNKANTKVTLTNRRIRTSTNSNDKSSLSLWFNIKLLCL